MKKLIAATLIVLVMGFSGLRVYGAYRTERTNAAARAEAARNEASIKEKEETELGNEFNQRLAERKLEHYYSGTMAEFWTRQNREMDADMKIAFAQGEAGVAAINLKLYAELEGRYSTNRKLQTLAIEHKVWLTLVGSTESQEQWVKFLVAHEMTKPGGELLP
jgi:hypothetical protein